MDEKPGKDESLRLEQIKLVFDVYKQIATLSVAGLVITLTVERPALGQGETPPGHQKERLSPLKTPRG